MTTAEPARLLRVRAADGGALLVLTVELDGECGTEKAELSVFAARMERVPTPGALSHEELTHLRREHALCGAMTLGLRLLSLGDHSVPHLVYKLRARGVEREVAELAARELAQAGYVNEERSALREAQKGLDKLWGDRRILAQLRGKGYGEVALACVRDMLASKDGAARCERLLQKRRITLPEDPKAQGKLVGALMRYGYDSGEIRAALRIDVDAD